MVKPSTGDAAAHELFDDAGDVGMQQRFAAGDRHHRGPALLDRANDVVDGQPLAQDVGRVLDLAAPRARQVACEQRLDLDDQGVVLVLLHLVADQVGSDSEVLSHGNWHLAHLLWEGETD